MWMLNFLRQHQTVFQNGCYQCIPPLAILKRSYRPTSYQMLAVVRTLNFYWMGVKPYVHKLISISNDYEHLFQFSSVQLLSHVRLFVTPWTAACQASYPSPTARVYPNLCPLSWWCHPIISSSVIPFSSCPQSFPASGCFLMSQFFTSGSQNIGVSASAFVLPMNIQDWFPLRWTGINSSVLSFLHSPTLTSIHDYWKNHSFD